MLQHYNSGLYPTSALFSSVWSPLITFWGSGWHPVGSGNVFWRLVPLWRQTLRARSFSGRGVRPSPCWGLSSSALLSPRLPGVPPASGQPPAQTSRLPRWCPPGSRPSSPSSGTEVRSFSNMVYGPREPWYSFRPSSGVTGFSATKLLLLNLLILFFMASIQIEIFKTQVRCTPR